MFMLSFRLTKRKIAVCFSLLLILVISIFAAAFFSSEHADAAEGFIAANDEQRAVFLKQYGWEVETAPLEKTRVIIPQEFDEVYTRYNEMQIAQGFDLSPYAGKTVTRYCYSVLNYPLEELVVANLLVYDNIIIGGDIDSPALDGAMHGFDKNLDVSVQNTWVYNIG